MKQKNRRPLTMIAQTMAFLGGLSALTVAVGLLNRFILHRGFYDGIELAAGIYCAGPIGTALGHWILASQRAEAEKDRR